MKMDLVLRGGRVIDPSQDIDSKKQIGIKNGEIKAILEPEEELEGKKMFDFSEKIVTPGLVDLHTHVYWGGVPLGVKPDPLMAKSGVTTFVDAGSAGAGNFEGFLHHVIKQAKSRIFAFLNIFHPGLVNGCEWLPRHERNPIHYASVPAALETCRKYPEEIVGIKVMASYDYNYQSTTAINAAIEVAGEFEKPIIVHVSAPPPTLREVLPLLRPGDILTHAFRGSPNSVIRKNGDILTEFKKAVDRGVLIDIGHGQGSFSFETAGTLIEQGVKPNSISSDIHQSSIEGPVYDLPTTLSKFMNLGMDLEEVIAASTIEPARIIGKENDIGHLKVGSKADIAVMGVEKGEFKFTDGVYKGGEQRENKEMTGSVKLIPETTILSGKIIDTNSFNPN